jgi:molecular chaperone HtpG
MPLELPPRLRDLINRERPTAGLIDTSANQFEAWIDGRKMVFFPEFTRHDIAHINEVVGTCVELIAEPAWSILTPKDALVLVLAALLHDSAMYLNEDMFLEIVGSEQRLPGVPGIDTKAWPVLWEEFLAEAARFDGKKLSEIFGDATEPAKPPPENPEHYTRRDLRLIGEFVRRHHTAIAHQIALSGLPAHAGGYYSLLPGVPDELKDLAGLTARSHGSELRSLFPYLERKYRVRDYNGVHAVYLMSLLRIGDYLQLQSDRAPVATTTLKKFQSPLSQNEWRVHQSVSSIDSTEPDPEAIFVKARPEGVRAFLRLRAWLSDLQGELDRAWAALGEIYGRYQQEGLAQLGLRLRRVRSNLDDVEQFAREVTYVPKEFRFGTAESELLNLLVGPLYANDPAVGIRELVQNSTDSCREMSDLVARGVTGPSSRKTQGDADVIVELSYGSNGLPDAVSVTDYGTGMTEEILRNYFLKAGASFRASSAWKEQFEDDKGHSRIARSGRFGVGALAPFLLGPRISVTTRHYSVPEAEGLAFDARIDEPSIEVRKTVAPVGTTVRVELSETAAKGLTEDEHGRARSIARFYCLRSPSVAFKSSKADPVRFRQSHIVPGLEEANSPSKEWLPIEQGLYAAAHWKWIAQYDYNQPGFFCNGIVVDEREYGTEDVISRRPPLIRFDNAAISIFDFDGRAPINLQRTSVNFGQLGIVDDIQRAMEVDFATFHAANPPLRLEGAWFRGDHSGYRGVRTVSYRPREYFDKGNWIFQQGGLQLYHPASVAALKLNRLIVLPSSDGWGALWEGTLKEIEASDGIIFFSDHIHPLRFNDVVMSAMTSDIRSFDLEPSANETIFQRLGVLPVALRTYLHSDWVDRMLRLKGTPKRDLRSIESFQKVGNWHTFSSGSGRQLTTVSSKLLRRVEKAGVDLEKSGVVFALLFDGAPKCRDHEPVERSPWTRVFGAAILPPDPTHWAKVLDRAKDLYPSELNRHLAQLESEQSRLREAKLVRP